MQCAWIISQGHPPPPGPGKIVFHKIIPKCQRGWEPLVKRIKKKNWTTFWPSLKSLEASQHLDSSTNAGKDWRQEEKGMHHWLDGHEFEQAPGVGDGQGGLACCSPWGCKESDMTEWLNWTNSFVIMHKVIQTHSQSISWAYLCHFT